ncbi:RidA family protein [Flavicella sp.]|uniref:RidA family protein n=1 Tax=Flavicella sp. TaxID=2957742 RepID=UPI0030175FE9
MKTIINTNNAPAPLGPYNQAVLANDILYISGQIAINPKTGEFVTDSIQEETKQVMSNLQAVLAKANMTFENIVKSSIFIKNMNDFSEINKIYGSYFDETTAPARETVEVSKLPKNVSLEISMIAHK